MQFIRQQVPFINTDWPKSQCVHSSILKCDITHQVPNVNCTVIEVKFIFHYDTTPKLLGYWIYALADIWDIRLTAAFIEACAPIYLTQVWLKRLRAPHVLLMLIIVAEALCFLVTGGQTISSVTRYCFRPHIWYRSICIHLKAIREAKRQHRN